MLQVLPMSKRRAGKPLLRVTTHAETQREQLAQIQDMNPHF